MSPTIHTIEEVFDAVAFDPSQLYASAPFTQAFFYGEWQKKSGRKVRRFLIKNGAEVIGAFQVIFYGLPFGKTFAYIPYGPIFACDVSVDLLLGIKREILKIAKKDGAIFVRLDPVVSEKYPFDAQIFAQVFKKAKKNTYHSAQFQPRLEWFLDLSQNLEDIERDFHKNTRYSVRVSEKNNVDVKTIDKNISEHIEVFYAVMKETSVRDGFSLHSRTYYENIFKQCDVDKNAVLFIASLNGKILAVNFVVLYGDTAVFVFGGTSNTHRDTMPAYANQWATIKYLKQLGFRWYNFGGISAEADKDISWKGLTAFKKRFGGKEVKRSPLFDIVAEPFWYLLYNIYKILRA